MQPYTSAIFCIFSLIILSSCQLAQKNQPLSTVSQVDLNRYLGTWYEIAAYPNYFQRGCKCTTANYSQEKTTISVINRCYRDGSWDIADGKARVVPNSGNAKLKVWFFWPFKGDYWIIDLDENYTYAVVGHPSRHYLWILSRSPQMEPSRYQKVLEFIDSVDFDRNRLVKTQQDCKDTL